MKIGHSILILSRSYLWIQDLQFYLTAGSELVSLAGLGPLNMTRAVTRAVLLKPPEGWKSQFEFFGFIKNQKSQCFGLPEALVGLLKIRKASLILRRPECNSDHIWRITGFLTWIFYYPWVLASAGIPGILQMPRHNCNQTST